MKNLLKLLLSLVLFFSVLILTPLKKTSAYSAKFSGYWVGNVQNDGAVADSVKVESYQEGIELLRTRTSTEYSVASLFYNSELVTSRYATLDFSAVPNVSTNSYMYVILEDGSTVRNRKEYANGYYYSGGVCLYADSGYDALSSGPDFYVGTYIGGLHSRIYRVMDDYHQYDIIPISLQQPMEYFVKNNKGSIVHYYQAAITKSSANKYGQTSVTLGKAPDFFETGVKYYSADQHYFYTSYTAMVDDLNDRTHEHAVNQTPWANYYQFLPFHTSTSYSAAEMDQYFKELGFNGFAYQLKNGYAVSDESVLYGSGTYFMQTQQIYGINPIILYSISVNETGWGQSWFAVNRRNLFGINAYDSDPGAASTYSSVMESIFSAADLLTSSYLVATGSGYYNGAFLGNKDGGANVSYASDPLWGEKAASYYYQFDLAMGSRDYNTYTLALSNKTFIKLYDKPNGKYIYNSNGTGSRYVRYSAYAVLGEEGDYYKVIRDASLADAPDWTDSGNTTKFDLENTYAYVLKSDVTIVNNPAEMYVSPKNSVFINKLRIKDEKKTVQVTAKTQVYTDAYLENPVNVTVAKDAVIYSDETGYTQNGNYAYKIVYNTAKGLCGWIKASDAKDVDGIYAVRAGTINSVVEAPVYAKADTSSTKINVVTYYREGVAVLERSGEWLKITTNATNNKTGWVKAAYFEDPITHKASGAATDNSDLHDDNTQVNPDPDPGSDPSDVDSYFTNLTQKSENMFYLDSISYNSAKNGIVMKGMLAIEGMDNAPSDPIVFHMLLENERSGEKRLLTMTRWDDVSEHPFDTSTVPSIKYDFNGAWFNAELDFAGVPDGNYRMTVVSDNGTYYTTVLLNNSFSLRIAQRFVNSEGTGLELRSDTMLKTIPLELIVRHNGLLSADEKPTLANSFIDYTNLQLNSDNLILKGTAFALGAEYSANVQRQLVFENLDTFERFTYDIGYLEKGDYEITLRVPDGKAKNAAWFSCTQSLAELPKGTYALYIVTTSTDGIKDYGELSDPFYRRIDSSTSNKQDITYSLSLDTYHRARILLTVE